MIVRFLLWVLVFMGAMWLWRRLQAALLVTGSPRPGRTVRSARRAGRMVRDRVCETFIPETSALRLEKGGEVHYFCSSACRDRYLVRQTRR